ncbi:hypothetical protein DH2020_001215 [Rehmannia glutinosa]|uniref:Uncharacterized protein n=1 Tax=Rehmannia glutinosa TaxID=99300 RepID=A0ABR0XZ23_REHGL
MRTPCCHTFLAFVLKFLNFLQAFVGVAIIVYSAYMLNQWQHHPHQFPPPPDESGNRLPADVISHLNFASGVVSSPDDALSFNVHSLPAPWFIYAFMGVGILVCCVTCIGHIGAEAINGCCLCFVSFSSLSRSPFSVSLVACVEQADNRFISFMIVVFATCILDLIKPQYAVLTTIFILLEVGLVAFIALDHNWKKDIPFDPTGELDSFRTFIEDNVDVFEWVGIAIVATQACFGFLFWHTGHYEVLSLLFAIILRSLVSGRSVDDDDIEGDSGFRSSTREPLLTPYSGLASGSTRGDSDIWSSRMRDKYGLSGGDAKHSLLNQNPSTDVKQ